MALSNKMCLSLLCLSQLFSGKKNLQKSCIVWYLTNVFIKIALYASFSMRCEVFVLKTWTIRLVTVQQTWQKRYRLLMDWAETWSRKRKRDYTSEEKRHPETWSSQEETLFTFHVPFARYSFQGMYTVCKLHLVQKMKQVLLPWQTYIVSWHDFVKSGPYSLWDVRRL